MPVSMWARGSGMEGSMDNAKTSEKTASGRPARCRNGDGRGQSDGMHAEGSAGLIMWQNSCSPKVMASPGLSTIGPGARCLSSRADPGAICAVQGHRARRGGGGRSR